MKIYSLRDDKKAYINIFGDIANESNNNIAEISNILNSLDKNVTEIVVNINSYGGEVDQGIAIYNALREQSKKNNRKIVTICQGFACSCASIVFLAGDERIMNDSTLLMIHNAWQVVQGNSAELRKQADALDKINNSMLDIYSKKTNLDRKDIVAMLDKETWLDSEECLKLGFATRTLNENDINGMKKVTNFLKNKVNNAYEEEQKEEQQEEQEQEQEEQTEEQTEKQEEEQEDEQEDEQIEEQDEVKNEDDDEKKRKCLELFELMLDALKK